MLMPCGHDTCHGLFSSSGNTVPDGSIEPEDVRAGDRSRGGGPPPRFPPAAARRRCRAPALITVAVTATMPPSP